MRRVLLMLLAAALALPAVPMAQAQAPANCGASQFTGIANAFWCDNFSGSRGAEWTPEVEQPSAPGMRWQKSAPGSGDGTSWFGGIVVSGPDGSDAARGYASVSAIYLTSPAIQLGSKVATGVLFEVRGEAEPGFDFLDLEVQKGGGAWTRIVRTDGAAPATAFTPLAANPADLAGYTGDVRLRFVFISDTGCDTVDPTCGDPSWPGYWVDNVVVKATDPPAPPTTTAPVAGNELPRLSNLAISGRTLDLTAAGTNVTTSLDVTDQRGVVLAEAYYQKDLDLVKVPLARGSGSQWTGRLLASEAALSTGTWAITLAAYDSDGAINATPFGSLAITATDAGPAPVVTLLGLDANREQSLGSGDVLRFQVDSKVLRRVSYQLLPDTGGRGPVVPMEAPYFLASSALIEGPQRVQVHAEDRLGRHANLTVRATLDTLAPEVAVAAPAVAYAGVPFTAQMVVKERSKYAAVVSAGGVLRSYNGTGPQVYDVTFTPDKPGLLAVSATVQDAVGHSTAASAIVDVLNLVADGALLELRPQANDLVAGDTAHLEAKVRQEGGLASVPFTVSLTGAHGSLSRNVTLAPNGEATVVFQLAGLTPGRHTVTALMLAPAAVNETQPANDVATAVVEVFLGRFTTDDGDTYRIRAGGNGQPESALDGKDGVHPLTLDQREGATLYRFQANGGNLTWDPLHPLEAPDEGKDASDPKGAPAPASAFLALAVLALAAALRRRS